MQAIILDKPYVPIPPHRGQFWPSILTWYLPRMLRKSYGITKIDYLNIGRLIDSIRAGHGVLLAPNHCRDEDPLVMGTLSKEVRSPFYIMASWHLFMQDRIKAFLLPRAGAFSIYREGIDRAAVNTAVELLAEAQRPLVIFAEGFISRTNDRINDLMDGTALIARSAAKKRAKMTPAGKVVVHPIALRYQFQGDVEKAAAAVLSEIESRLTWHPNEKLSLVDRIYKVGTALLTLKELDYLGQPQTGSIPQRLSQLIDAILGPLEDQWVDGNHSDSVNARAKRLRAAILPDMVKGEITEDERQRRWKQLADVYLAMQLFHYPPDYVRSNPTPHRILETVERFEEDLTDRIRLHGPLHVTVTVGEAIEVSPIRESRGEDDPLLVGIESQLKSMLGLPAEAGTQ